MNYWPATMPSLAALASEICDAVIGWRHESAPAMESLIFRPPDRAAIERTLDLLEGLLAYTFCEDESADSDRDLTSWALTSLLRPLPGPRSSPVSFIACLFEPLVRRLVGVRTGAASTGGDTRSKALGFGGLWVALCRSGGVPLGLPGVLDEKQLPDGWPTSSLEWCLEDVTEMRTGLAHENRDVARDWRGAVVLALVLVQQSAAEIQDRLGAQPRALRIPPAAQAQLRLLSSGSAPLSDRLAAADGLGAVLLADQVAPAVRLKVLRNLLEPGGQSGRLLRKETEALTEALLDKLPAHRVRALSLAALGSWDERPSRAEAKGHHLLASRIMLSTPREITLALAQFDPIAPLDRTIIPLCFDIPCAFGLAA